MNITIAVRPCPDHKKCVEASTVHPAARVCGSELLDVLSTVRGVVFHALGDWRSVPETVSFSCEAST